MSGTTPNACPVCHGLGRYAIADVENGPEFDVIVDCECHISRDEPPLTPVEQRIREDEARGFNLVRCTACGQKVHLRRARLGLCPPCHDERYRRKFVSNGGDEMTIVYDPREEER